MGFDNDIFISYAHIDNEPLTEGQEGWISDFHHALEIRLAQLRGEKPRIWRDPKLQGNEYFGDTIIQRLPKVAILVTVLSPRYVKSDWCVKELKEFCKAASETGGIRIGDKSRVFKVIKTPIPPEKHPKELQEQLGYEFFEIDPNGRPREFSKIWGPDAERNYWQKINDLAYDIYQLLEQLEPSEEKKDQQDCSFPEIAIYLAETTMDLAIERDRIKRELLQKGYLVLPEQPLPYGPNFASTVQENLERCKLSVHLIGARYGIVPEGYDKSVTELQYEIASTATRQVPEFSKLVWMPVGMSVLEERQLALVDLLRNDQNFLQTNLEELKTLIEDKLRTPISLVKQNLTERTEDQPIKIYLIFDRRDFDAVEAMDNYLFDLGYEVIKPLFEGDEVQVREDHQESLQQCDAVLIYYGVSSELWLRTKLRDVQKVVGYGRSKPLITTAIYVADPSTPQKERYRSHEALVMKGFGGFSSDQLQPFLGKLNSGLED